MVRGSIAVLGSVALAALSACAGPGGARESTPLVLVAGATGGTGQQVVEQAVSEGYRVRALVRDEAKARMLFGDRVQYAVGDVRRPRSLRAAVRGVDYVVCAVGANGKRDPENSPELVDYRGVKALAEAAAAAGVEHFVLVSSMGVTHPDRQLNAELDDVLLWKLEGEKAVRAAGLGYTIVRPGSLTNEPDAGQSIRVLQGDPPDVVGEVSRATLATVLVNALGRGDAYRKTFEIVSDPAAPGVDWSLLFSGLKPDVG